MSYCYVDDIAIGELKSSDFQIHTSKDLCFC